MTDKLDVAIFGGGIMGLLVLRALRASGKNAYLFESASLGGGQTLHSQAYLIRGHLYALSAGKYPLDVIIRKKRAFDAANALWTPLLFELGIVPQGPTYYVMRKSERELEESWMRASLSFRQPSEVPMGLQSSKDGWSSPFDSLECFIPDSRILVEALAGDLRGYIRRGELSKAPNRDGAFEVSIEGKSRTLRARAVVVATNAEHGHMPERAKGKVLGALVVRGRTTPNYALVTNVVLDEKDRLIMCVPRRRGHQRAWLCSVLLNRDSNGNAPEQWAERILPQLRERCSLSGDLDVSKYEVDFWPDLAAPLGSQLEREGRAIYAWPARLTLAPLFARRVVREVSAILSKGQRSGPSDVPDPGELPAPAEERWYTGNTTSVDGAS